MSSPLEDCKALIKPDMLRWARERAGWCPAQVDIATGFLPGTCEGWEQGEELSVGEAQIFACACGVNFACLFLPEPPAPVGPLELQEALETVLEWAREGIIDEEQRRGGREAFVRRHGERDYEALAMVEAFIKGRQ